MCWILITDDTPEVPRGEEAVRLRSVDCGTRYSNGNPAASDGLAGARRTVESRFTARLDCQRHPEPFARRRHPRDRTQPGLRS